MKKKLLVILILFLLTKSYGQTTRYIYETSVNPDSINLVSMKVERTFLDIKGDKSLFISEHKLIKDSIVSAFKQDGKIDNKKEEKDFSKLGRVKLGEQTFFDFFIVKNIPEQKVYYYDRAVGRQIYYLEDRPVKWEITNEVEKQNGYSAQKATVNFGGRIWTAWFAKDIHISDGPYKFSGLPGLIVKLEDDKGDYKFDLVQKIIVKNPFEETINTNAKESSRINFHGDKAALELEFSKNRKSMAGNAGGDMQGFEGGGKHGGGMNGGGMGGMRGGGGHGGGMHRGGMGMNGGNSGFSMPSSGGNSGALSGGIQNPIELQ
ncbi:GLPGLI family protein [Chryseobacterium paridis]|uniref:GLPGLI family protein n=1 Tax=Chryseobacterium paridis TaxID=2800328 RepID=A0ABS1FQW9_9FLAO|nr:GLPGLI family protein [Chryseobacterium paridis]MBK1894618.1 GLPGLI family protein [Chryseobacterium paridis]